jgi:hypothetical protein
MTRIKVLIAIAIALFIGVAGCTVSEGNPDDVDSLLTAPIEDEDGSIGSLFEPPAEEDTEVTDDDDDEIDDDDDDKDKDIDDDVELNPLTISGDEDIDVGSGKDFEQIYSARGGNDDEFDWEITGAPDWVEHELDGDRRIIIRGKAPFSTADQSFTLELTAIDALDENFSATETVTINVLGLNLPPIKAEFYGSQCSEPLKIHIEKNRNKLDKGEPLREKPVVIGDVGQNVVLRVTRGDNAAPLGKVKWSWNSKVDESYYCTMDNRKGALGALDKLDDIKYIGKAFPIGNDAYYPIKIDGDDFTFGKECLDEDEGQWTRNYSWRLGDEGPGDGSAKRHVTLDGDTLYLRGDFIFAEQPMPVNKFYDDGVEDLNRNPVERLTVKVSDGCEAGDSGEIELEFHLEYPKDPVGNMMITVNYENAESYDKEGYDYCENPHKSGHCKAFLHSNISFHFLSEDPEELCGDGCDAPGLRPMLDDGLGFSVFRLKELEEKGDGNFKERVTALGKSGHIHNIKHIMLRTDGVGTIKEETKWILIVPYKMDVHYYDDIDIKMINFETSYWEAIYYDDDGSDEWTWKNDMLHDYTNTYNLFDYDEMGTKNSHGGYFHRKTWMPKNFVEGSFEAELILDE